MSAAWAEITSLEHGHGGAGWELGRCLWSPTASKDGANRYGAMRLPAPGDEVFHLAAGVLESALKQRFLFGVSRIRQAATVVNIEPPSPGVWKDAGSYFRIELGDFRELESKHAMDAVEAGLEDTILSDLLLRPKYYPYSRYRAGFRGAQGIYLSKLSASLAAAFRGLSTGLQAEQPIAPVDATRVMASEYAEGERALREQWFFKRNPALRVAAIQRHGLNCAACALNFSDRYGLLGEGYIEIHHMNPLSERSDTIQGTFTTSIDEVVPLCANCHRMIHRRRPPLTIAELQSVLQTPEITI